MSGGILFLEVRKQPSISGFCWNFLIISLKALVLRIILEC